jgi:hypothetical protein
MNGTPHSVRSISSSVILLLAISARAATVWDGPMISFTKSNYANPLLAENQDRLTANVWMTRGSAQGPFNANTESRFTHSLSPVGTEWANGSLENYATLSYTDWNHWARGVNPSPPSTVGVQAVLHLIPDDIYLSVRFTSWSRGAPGGGPSFGGGFSYLRSTPVPVPEPSSLLLFGILGLGAAFAARCSARRVRTDRSGKAGTGSWVGPQQSNSNFD